MKHDALPYSHTRFPQKSIPPMRARPGHKKASLITAAKAANRIADV